MIAFGKPMLSDLVFKKPRAPLGAQGEFCSRYHLFLHSVSYAFITLLRSANGFPYPAPVANGSRKRLQSEMVDFPLSRTFQPTDTLSVESL